MDMADRRVVLAPLGLGLTPFNAALSEQFRQGLGERGHVEGRHYRLDVQDGGATDMVLVRGARALAAAKAASPTIPIVAVDLGSDPMATGAVRSLAQPGGNVTGVFLDLPDLTAKQLQLLNEAIPSASRVAVFGDSSMNAPQFRAAESAARSMGWTRPVARTPRPCCFSRRSGLLPSRNLGDLAVKKHLPAVSMFVEFAEAGGLLAYGPSIRECFRRAGVFAARILEGAKPADMPVERPTTFELVINRMTAKALGLTMPASIARRADRVIE